MRPLLALLCAQASAAVLHPSPRPHAARCCHRARVAATAAAAPETCEVLEANLLRLCALTDRGQRASPEQESELRAAIASKKPIVAVIEADKEKGGELAPYQARYRSPSAETLQSCRL